MVSWISLRTGLPQVNRFTAHPSPEDADCHIGGVPPRSGLPLAHPTTAAARSGGAGGLAPGVPPLRSASDPFR